MISGFLCRKYQQKFHMIKCGEATFVLRYKNSRRPSGCFCFRLSDSTGQSTDILIVFCTPIQRAASEQLFLQQYQVYVRYAVEPAGHYCDLFVSTVAVEFPCCSVQHIGIHTQIAAPVFQSIFFIELHE